MTRSLAGAAFAFLVPALAAGCVTQSGGSVATEHPAAPAMVAERFSPPAAGTRLTYRNRGWNQTTEQIWVVGTETFGGRPVLAYASPDGRSKRLHDLSTGTYFATVEDGAVTSRTAPNFGDLDWPLSVGKEWTASYTYEAQARGRPPLPFSEDWSVAGVETVTVPAGTFTAFRLVSKPEPRAHVAQRIKWFAPELGVSVKSLSEYTPRHSRGYGLLTSELIAYEPPAAE